MEQKQNASISKQIVHWAATHLAWNLAEYLFPSPWKAVIVAACTSAVGFMLAVIRHLDLAAAWLYALGGVVLYAIGWAAVHIGNYAANKIPTEVEVRLREIYKFTAQEDRRQIGFDVFVRARVELKRPRRMKLSTYRLELSRYGQIDGLEMIDDINKQQTWSMNPDEPEENAVPLSLELRKGQPSEGWLHFITKQTTSRHLEESAIRLLAQTNNDSWFAEAPPDPRYWNPRRIAFIGKDKIP